MKIILMVLLLNFCFYAQNFQHAIPNVNIDSLISNMPFLGLANRANLQTAMKISFQINDSGELEDLRFIPMFKDSLSANDSFFVKKMKYKLKTVKWISAKYSKQSVSSVYTIPFVFFNKNSSNVLNNHYSKKDKYLHSSTGNYDYTAPIITIIKKSYGVEKRMIQ